MNREIYNFLLWDQKLVKGERSGLSLITLKDFLYKYGEDLQNYYGEDFYVKGDEEEWLHDNSEDGGSDTMILCMADLWGEDNTFVKQGVKKKIKKAGSQRRKRIKHRYNYVNPMNRIHGFVILKREYVKKFPEKKIMAISTIATSSFSEKRGVGSDLMDMVVHLSKVCKYDDIILEAANEFAYYAFEEEEEEDEEEEEEWSEEEEEEEEDNIWYPTDEVLDVISHELWRKTMRKPEGDNPYYNIDKNYIWSDVKDYLLNETVDTDQLKDGQEYETSEDPQDCEYGGFWYKKGKVSQTRLMKFYEKFGFFEDPNIYLKWGCYDKYPYPTMRYSVVS